MQKPLALSIAACLGLVGCQVFEKSETWDKATQVRPGETTRDPDPSNAYAAKLHRVLAQDGVEHKVVVYQYRYTTRLREEAIGTRTAVIYRDNSSSRYPWWIKDDRLNKPVWLPNGNLDKQVSFYLRRKAEILEEKNYPAQGGSGKTTIAFARPTQKLRPAPQPQPQVAVIKVQPKKVAAPVVRKPSPTRVVVKAPAAKKPVQKMVIVKASVAKKTAPKPLVTRVKLPIQAPAPSKFFAVNEASQPQEKPLEPITSRSNDTSWSAPTLLDSKEQSPLTAPRDTHLEKLFRTKHGTDYNRFSPADRRKMQQLQNGVAVRD